MLNQIKELILDYQRVALDLGVSRKMEVMAVKNKASIYIGVRRCGKSTLMYQTIDRLLQAGASRENILYINFFDERLHGIREFGLKILLEAYFSLYPHKKKFRKNLLFF